MRLANRVITGYQWALFISLKGISMKTLYAFLKDEKGVTAIEYGIVGAIVLVAAITAIASWVRS